MLAFIVGFSIVIFVLGVIHIVRSAKKKYRKKIIEKEE